MPVAESVREKYPFVAFTCESFAKGDGSKKLERVENFIAQKQPVIVSLANEPFGGTGWHIMVVVDSTANDLLLLESVELNGTKHTKAVSKNQFVRIHDEYQGGDEIAYLTKWKG